MGEKRHKFPREAALLSEGIRELDGPPKDAGDELEGPPDGMLDLSAGLRCGDDIPSCCLQSCSPLLDNRCCLLQG